MSVADDVAAGAPWSGLDAATESVSSAAMEANSYAYRFDVMTDGSALATYMPAFGQPAQLVPFPDLETAGAWHPNIDQGG